MDKEQITKTVIQGLQNPSASNAMSYVLEGGSSPSAATGRKN
jgi:hypothetical protein